MPTRRLGGHPKCGVLQQAPIWDDRHRRAARLLRQERQVGHCAAPARSAPRAWGPYGLEGISGTQAHDASGKGDHGALTNVTGSNARKFGRALSFNGASEFS